MQHIIYTNEAGERRVEMMRWGFKLPNRLLFNARSEGIAHAKFWKNAFVTGRAIAPGDDGQIRMSRLPCQNLYSLRSADG